jgi:hypothetical protein
MDPSFYHLPVVLVVQFALDAQLGRVSRPSLAARLLASLAIVLHALFDDLVLHGKCVLSFFSFVVLLIGRNCLAINSCGVNSLHEVWHLVVIVGGLLFAVILVIILAVTSLDVLVSRENRQLQAQKHTSDRSAVWLHRAKHKTQTYVVNFLAELFAEAAGLHILIQTDVHVCDDVLQLGNALCYQWIKNMSTLATSKRDVLGFHGKTYVGNVGAALQSREKLHQSVHIAVEQPDRAGSVNYHLHLIK